MILYMITWLHALQSRAIATVQLVHEAAATLMDIDCDQHILPGHVLQKQVGVRAAVGVTCVLSVIGSLLIIFSYVLFPNLRTRARYILVHLSITDLVLAVSNLVGDVANFDSHVQRSTHINHSNEINDTIYCKIQGFFTLYSTLSSVLWTILLAVFVYILVTAGNPKRITKFLMWFCYLLCYGLPLLPSVWALVTDRLGYAPLQSSGWCTLKSHTVLRIDNDLYCGKAHIYINVFAYNLWIIVAFGVILFTYLSVHCHVNKKVSEYYHMMHADR